MFCLMGDEMKKHTLKLLDLLVSIFFAVAGVSAVFTGDVTNGLLMIIISSLFRSEGI